MKSRRASALFALLLLPAAAHAGGGFAIDVAPPRFELKARAGEVLRETIEMRNAGDGVANYRLSTVDWSLDAQGGIVTQDRVGPDSCRNWVALERKTVQLAPRSGVKRYRFEVRVPEKQAAARECRFGIVLESADSVKIEAGKGAAQFPVTGRLVIVVYVAVGAVTAKLSYEGGRLARAGGTLRPVFVLRNDGDAHGRASGLLDAVDAGGRKYQLLLSTLPILPGERRELPLAVKNLDGSEATVAPAPPLKIRGKIEWDGGGRDIAVTLH